PSNESSTARVISVCEIQPSFYLTTPIRRLFDPSNDQSTPNDSVVSIDYKNTDSITPPSTNLQHMKYSNNNDNNKENSHYLSTLTPMTSSSSSSSSDVQNTTELSSIPNLIDDDSQQSSSSSLPADASNDDHRCLPTMPSLSSDSETLDEGFETQSNVSETVEPTPRSCPLETTSNEINETKSEPNDETLADELTRRLTFSSTRRLSHDSNIRNNSRRTSLSHGRPTSLLKTSTSAYSYPTYTSNGQQNQQSKTSISKRTPSAESLRSISNNNNNNAANGIRSSRHIQRCAVSRRIWTEKDVDEASKTLTTSPPPSLPQPFTLQNTMEPDEVSSSSTLTAAATTATRTTTTTSTTSTATTITNHRLASAKPKAKILNIQSVVDSSFRAYSPIIRKVSTRLGHASSCQNVSTTTMNSPKATHLTKTRSPPNFFLNSNQLLRSSFTRPNEKPLRAYQMSNTTNNESASLNRPSPRTRRLFSSNTSLESTSISSPKNLRKPPSSWPHQKPLANNTTVPTALPSTSLNPKRKTSASTIDLRKTNPMNSSVFQRLNHSKRL
ncbi:unnamed protein product, partial [Rotaria socialis]